MANLCECEKNIRQDLKSFSGNGDDLFMGNLAWVSPYCHPIKKKDHSFCCNPLILLVGREGIEPSTY